MATRYIKKYADETAIHTAVDNKELLNPYVAYDESASTIDWNSYIYIDYSKEPLTFDIISGGTIYLYRNQENFDLDYNLNNSEWQTINFAPNSADTSGTNVITVNSGDILQFRGNKGYFNRKSSNLLYVNFILPSAEIKFNVYGNCMSLLNYDFVNNQSLVDEDYKWEFEYLFLDNNGLISAENLILPATTLTNSCYMSMFRGCTSLTTAPTLPATTLAETCYRSMFQDCTGLTTAPELPATTLANYCYGNMFQDCTGLTTAPELPATTLAKKCYQNMFQNCRSLTTAPELPATTLAEYCYYSMFGNCASLNYIKCLATDISATNCTQYWVTGVASSGTFVKASSMNDWTTGNNGIRSGWTVEEV